MAILLPIITIIIILLIPTLFLILFFIPNYKATIERARKIDPSVKTLTDANFVLSKELAKNVGANDKEE